MPISVNLLDDGRGIEFISSGTVTGEQVIHANEKVYARENLQHLRYKIVDRTDCTDYLVTAEEVEAIARQDREAARVIPHLVVALVSPTQVQFGASRMWEAHVEGSGFKTGVFKDRKSADAWLSEQLAAPGDSA